MAFLKKVKKPGAAFFVKLCLVHEDREVGF
jgi:hypothetical protein